MYQLMLTIAPIHQGGSLSYYISLTTVPAITLPHPIALGEAKKRIWKRELMALRQTITVAVVASSYDDRV